MGKWLNLVEDDALESFAWKKLYEVTHCKGLQEVRSMFGDIDAYYSRVNLLSLHESVEVDWCNSFKISHDGGLTWEYVYDHREYYYDDFFALKYNDKNKTLGLGWNDEYYNSNEALCKIKFDKNNDVMRLVDMVVSSLKQKNLDYKPYIKEFKKAYINAFDVKNTQNNRTQLVKKLFKAIDEKYLQKEDELTK